ncbi:MAG: 3-isopropylmalate dehydratase large subunit [Elusimicrobiota bacterium]
MSYVKKIFRQKLGIPKLATGDFIEIDVDVILSNDITTPLAIDAFEAAHIDRIAYPERVVIVADHFTPNKDIASAMQVKKVRDFANRHELRFYDAGCGIEHVILPEKGLVLPGDVVIGADSHTCTYGALGAFATGVGSTDVAAAWATGRAWFKVPPAIKMILNGSINRYVSGKDIILHIISLLGVEGARYKGLEFCGEALKELSLDSRFTMANMAIECGAKYGIMTPDRAVVDYVEKRAPRPYSAFEKNYSIEDDKEFEEIVEIDCSIIKPQVAFPSLPSNSKAVDTIERVKVDQVVLGSCTNGRYEDFVKAAKIVEGRKVAEGLRFIVIPGSADIYKEMLDTGLLKIFVETGAIISPPTCGPCLGGHMGILAKGEIALSTTNRNFVGRMGHKESEVYLSNPEVAAATAIAGYIISPGDL